jgi:hypothetical protein
MRFFRRCVAVSVPVRIFGGFAIVLVLLAVLAVVALRGMDSVADGADRVSHDSIEASASSQVGLLVHEARAQIVQYALTGAVNDQKAAQLSLARLDDRRRPER